MDENSNEKKILQYLVAAETLGNEIIEERRHIIRIDKLRNEFREALRDLKKSGEKKCYLSIGSVFVKNNVNQAISLLETDIIKLNVEYNKVRSNLKVKVNEFRDLEMFPPIPGLSLVPLEKDEQFLKY